jgi:HipA-like protein
MKQGLVYKKDKLVGLIWEDENGYSFQYDKDYLSNPISLLRISTE